MIENDPKQSQRRAGYESRNRQADKDRASRLIFDTLLRQSFYRQAATVMFYLHCRSEVRTLDVVRQELARNKRIVIPYCTRDDEGANALGLWKLDSLGELEPGTWGILEPPRTRRFDTARRIEPGSLDLIVVPGVAFDRQGGRLGNGAGYYDGLLRRVGPGTRLVGVCYEAQLLDHVVMEPHDVFMHCVITERSVYWGQGRPL